VLSHLESTKGLGFEVFWLDAYWIKGGFGGGVGNYGFPIERVEPRDRFPHGLRPISDAAAKAGMKFLLWFEPERVSAGTYLAKEHPEWVISPGGDGGGLFNLGTPPAREFMTSTSSRSSSSTKWIGCGSTTTSIPRVLAVPR